MDYAGKRVTVMGLGRFGGGVGAVRFLVQRQARVTVTDLRSEIELAESIAALKTTPPAEWRLGGHVAEDFARADLLVANPAVTPDNPFLQIAREHQVPITSEIRLFWQHNRGRVIGVTGSNGKSTTAALIHSILSATGRPCWLGGNIGASLLAHVERIRPEDWVVLELSSFQLDDLNRIGVSPQVAVVTNFRPNHLDWHGTLDRYREAKQTILRWQRPEHVAVLNADDPEVRGWQTEARHTWFGHTPHHSDGVFDTGEGGLLRIGDTETVLPLDQWSPLPGRHNRENVLAAITAASIAGAEPGAIEQGLLTFCALPHRLQLVARAKGRAFYNDSKATTPEAALQALDSFTGPIVLLAGGYDKKLDLRGLARGIAAKTKAVALMGQTAEDLANALTSESHRRLPHHRCCESLTDAFNWAVEQSAPGDVVILSPGCASYDWFRDFEDRGRQFTELAIAWADSVPTPRSANEQLQSKGTL